MEGVLRVKYGCRVQCSFNNRKIFTHRIDGQTSIAVENLYIKNTKVFQQNLRWEMKQNE